MFSFCIGFRNWNLDNLRRCVRSIERIRTPEDEVIVCDLGSDLVLLTEVLYVTNGNRSQLIAANAADWSRSEALNRAAAQARQPWLVLTDADSLFPEDWREAARAYCSETTISFPLALTRSRDTSQETMRLIASESSLPGCGWLRAHTEPHPDVGQGAAMVAARGWFQCIGGFDEVYRTWSCEDNDLALRAEWDTGHQTPWIPGAWVAHQWHSREWGNTPEIAAQVWKNRHYLAARITERGPIVRNLHLTRGNDGEHAAR